MVIEWWHDTGIFVLNRSRLLKWTSKLDRSFSFINCTMLYLRFILVATCSIRVLAFTGLQNIRSHPNRGIFSTSRPTTVLFNAIGDMIRLDDSNRRDVLGGGGKPVLIDVFAPVSCSNGSLPTVARNAPIRYNASILFYLRTLLFPSFHVTRFTVVRAM